MRTSYYLLPLIFAASLQLAPAVRARSIDMIAVAEQTNKGAQVQPPIVDNPAFYVAYDGGYIEAGDPIAGEHPPTAAVVGQALRQALATQGYQPAPGGVGPSLLLIYHWGSINKDTIEIPRVNKIKPGLRARIYLVGSTRDAAMLENFLLARKSAPIANDWAPVPGFLTGHLPDILGLANDDRYFVVVSAYDYAAITRREPALLWRLKLSARSVSGGMNEVLPALINGGASLCGRNLAEAEYLKVPLNPVAGGAAANAPAPMPPPPAATASQPDAGFVDKLVKQEHGLFSGEDVADPAAEMPGGGPAGTAAATRDPIPSALTGKIASYRQEKLALQDALAARIKAEQPGPDSRAAIDAFNQEYAGRIAALARTRESIRDQLSKLASTNSDPAATGPLNALLKEYAADVQTLEPQAGGASR